MLYSIIEIVCALLGLGAGLGGSVVKFLGGLVGLLLDVAEIRVDVSANYFSRVNVIKSFSDRVLRVIDGVHYHLSSKVHLPITPLIQTVLLTIDRSLDKVPERW